LVEYQLPPLKINKGNKIQAEELINNKYLSTKPTRSSDMQQIDTAK